MMPLKIALHLACYPKVDRTWNYLTPLGIGTLASCLKRDLPRAQIILPRDSKVLFEEKPHVVGLSYSTQNALWAEELARSLKSQLGCVVIAGGPHISTLPTHLPEGFDAGVIREGERTFVELMQLMQDKGTLAEHDLRKIPGIVYRDSNGQVVKSEARAPITNLAELPIPDRSLMYDQWLSDPREAVIMTSRGCPFDCSFCNTVRVWGRKLRHRPINAVLDEMEQVIREHAPKRFHIYDDLFIANPNYALDLMAGIRERGLHQDIEWSCFVRPSVLSDELMEAFVATNFSVLNTGFESGSDNSLSALGKGPNGEEHNHRAIALGKKYKVRFSSCFIFGAKGETRKDVQKTFDFVTDNRDTLFHVQFVPLIILPGTPMWAEARTAGMGENDLTGIAPIGEDWDDEEAFILKRWRYLNEDLISREEMYSILKFGRNLETMLWRHTHMRNYITRLENGTHRSELITQAAEQIPMTEIVKAKAKRRLSRLMPLDPSRLIDSARESTPPTSRVFPKQNQLPQV